MKDLLTEEFEMKFVDPNVLLPKDCRTCLLLIEEEDTNCDGYLILGYYERGQWYTWNGCATRIYGSEFVVGWLYVDTYHYKGQCKCRFSYDERSLDSSDMPVVMEEVNTDEEVLPTVLK